MVKITLTDEQQKRVAELRKRVSDSAMGLEELTALLGQQNRAIFQMARDWYPEVGTGIFYMTETEIEYRKIEEKS